jgi:hypothetical protein
MSFGPVCGCLRDEESYSPSFCSKTSVFVQLVSELRIGARLLHAEFPQFLVRFILLSQMISDGRVGRDSILYVNVD